MTADDIIADGLSIGEIRVSTEKFATEDRLFDPHWTVPRIFIVRHITRPLSS